MEESIEERIRRAAFESSQGRAEPAANAAPDHLERAQRAQADLENYRKRAQREISEAAQRGQAALLKALLPAIDSFERAREVAQSNQALDTDPALLSGMRMAESELIAGLEKVGIERFGEVGDIFDPHIHEAMLQQPSEMPPGSVIGVFSAGYRQGETIIRPASVVVSGGPATPESGGRDPREV